MKFAELQKIQQNLGIEWEDKEDIIRNRNWWKNESAKNFGLCGEITQFNAAINIIISPSHRYTKEDRKYFTNSAKKLAKKILLTISSDVFDQSYCKEFGMLVEVAKKISIE